MAALSERHGHHQEGILSLLHHHSDDDDDDDDENNITTMKVGALQRRRRSVSADMSNDQTRSVDHVNTWFAPKTEAEAAPPYVHPLVKKSASAASLKSLEACTESLGSESGSDGFSSLPIQERQVGTTSMVEMTRNYNKPRHTRSSFPPPIPSLSYHHQDAGQAGQGQALHVRSHRNLGRLVLEATAHPMQAKNFQAQREDGRLLLAFTKDHKEEEEEKEEIGSNHHTNTITKEGDEVEDDAEEEDETRVLKSCKLDPSKTSTSLLSWGKPPPHLLLTS